MNYVALYRRWRPVQFKDVVGQEHITTTLKNQITNNRIGHAYLFTGTRGTGKTTMAKIFAKAVNCPESALGEPCGDCNVCKEIESARVMDILEIDAASNNGVDNIRELREQVKYPPAIGKYKVYIVDEVHMLSSGAFNALLKTLEEPPKHIIFILATTEPQKLPATILSRCQRFDFKRVSVEDMVKRMDYITKQMNINIDKGALELIGKRAEGALRDALSILDQCLSLRDGDEEIAYKDIVDTLGLAPEEWLEKISASLINQDIRETMKSLHQMIDGGKDIIQIVKQLVEYFRNMLIAKTIPNASEILELPLEQIESLFTQGKNIDEGKLFSFINYLNETEYKIKLSSQPIIILEMELMGLCRNPSGKTIEELIERVELLEKNLKDGLGYKREIPTPSPVEAPVKDIHKETKEKVVSIQGEKEKVIEGKEKAKEPIESSNQEVSLEDINNKWQEILNTVRENKVQVEALLKEGQPRTYKENILTISFDLGFHQAKLSEKENTELLERIISGVMGRNLKVSCVMEDQILAPKTPEEDPVKAAIEAFGEDVVEVVGEDED